VTVIERIIISVLTALASRFMEWALERVKEYQDELEDREAAEERLKKFNDAVRDIKAGDNVTKEQKQEFRDRARDLIRGGL
jgi:Tfp pilus assembly protein PilO